MASDVTAMDASTTMTSGNITTDAFVPNPYADVDLSVNRYVTLVTFAIGFPGNIFCFLIWIQKRMRHSSGCYLAALALTDFIFLLLLVLYELQTAWGLNTIDNHVLCSVFPVMHLVFQYLSPLLVLAFTTERYISICHPFKREKFCTIRRAKIVIACLVLFTFSLGGVQGYFWTMLPSRGANGTVESYRCTLREGVNRGGTKSIRQIYSTCVDMLCFLVGNAAVLVLNVLVIFEMRRLSKAEARQMQMGGPRDAPGGPGSGRKGQKGQSSSAASSSSQRTAATTVMLLCVSFYQILTTVPISIAYALYMEFDAASNAPTLGRVEAHQRYYRYTHVMTFINEYGITHYAFNIFIYLVTGKMFRQQLRLMLKRPFAKCQASFPRDYASLRNTTIRASSAANGGGGSVGSGGGSGSSGGKNATATTTWLSVNGNEAKKGDKVPNANETLL